MKTKEDLVARLKDHELMKEGSRNDDAVNLAILATIDHGVPSDVSELANNVALVCGNYRFKFHDPWDRDDYMDRLERILPYLGGWLDDGIIYYAID